jgi:hypothetical protein
VASKPDAVDRAMLTFWPMQKREDQKLVAADCNELIDRYDFSSGVAAAKAAGLQDDRLALKRGPFLIELATGEDADGRAPSPKLVDLSEVDGEENFRKAFVSWRTQFNKNGAAWRDPFAPAKERGWALRDVLDRRGERLSEIPTPG